MSRILVTGGSGQLASALARKAAPGQIQHVGRPAFDFDRPQSIDEVFASCHPDIVINTAAWTAVDAAETDPEGARRANRDGPERLAQLCAGAGIPIIHISTDYVFDGSKGAPYVEDDPINPRSIYGATKLAGEAAVLENCPRAIILRTSWVYAASGKNFVTTMLGASRKTGQFRVVADQTGCPTSADDLAAVVLDIAGILRSTGWNDSYRGIFHAAGEGSTSWHGLACALFEEAAQYGNPVPEVMAITTDEWPTPAHRPPDSRLDCTKLETVFGLRLPPWRISLSKVVSQIFDRP
ncbi:MAG: dTDP-4-dehydrorhamnose reductase [Parvibaculaceae bacterium]|nr:dTDP-4-dehydrorhamnose reductase [Parvibaculaceae bacterium]